MDISIVIVSWNAKEYLKECLESLANELAPNSHEIFVVDNASTDGSPEMVKDEFPNVKLICNENNLGFSKANNIAIKQSKGKYICLINSDIKVLKGCINGLVEYMEKHPEVGIVGPKILGANGIVQRSCMGFPTVWNNFCRALALDALFPKSKSFSGQLMTYWGHDTLRKVDIINGCFWLVNRESLNEVGLLDERFFIFAEDKDWCKRFWESGWEVVFYPKASVIHYGGASSSNAPLRFYIEMHRANLQYWKKHHNKLSLIGYKITTLLHHIVRIMGQLSIYVIKSSKRGESVLKIKRSAAIIGWLFNISNRNQVKTIKTLI